jgi:hypothetical protein
MVLPHWICKAGEALVRKQKHIADVARRILGSWVQSFSPEYQHWIEAGVDGIVIWVVLHSGDEAWK